MRALRQMISPFGTDRGGNIAVIFTPALQPVMTAIGCALDDIAINGDSLT